jgi:polygalacturonase
MNPLSVDAFAFPTKPSQPGVGAGRTLFKALLVSALLGGSLAAQAADADRLITTTGTITSGSETGGLFGLPTATTSLVGYSYTLIVNLGPNQTADENSGQDSEHSRGRAGYVTAIVNGQRLTTPLKSSLGSALIADFFGTFASDAGFDGDPSAGAFVDVFQSLSCNSPCAPHANSHEVFSYALGSSDFGMDSYTFEGGGFPAASAPTASFVGTPASFALGRAGGAEHDTTPGRVSAADGAADRDERGESDDGRRNNHRRQPCSPLTYGAVGDGTIGTNNGTLNTAAIQSAIDACAARGGGIVALSPVPSGQNVYLTGPIQLRSHVYLEINAGVTLLATTDQGQYSIANIDYPMPGTNVSPYVPTAPYEALVFAHQALDTGIIGSGVINGQGNVVSDSNNRPAGTGTGATRFDGPSYIGTTVGTPTSLYSWWTLPSPGNGASLNGTTWYKAPQTDIPTSNGPARPWLVEFYECSNVLVNGITLVDSPMWNLVLRYSSHITVTNYHVQNYSDAAATIPAPTIGPNTDGMDPVGSSYLTISNIFVQVGDDDIAIKSGLPTDVVSGVQLPPGTDQNQIGLPAMPSHDIKVTNVNMTGGHGISIGSEASNGVYNVTIQNVHSNGSSLSEGLRIKTGRTRGNYATGIHDITVNNMIATNVVQPILIFGYYPAGGPPNETGFTTQCTLTTTTNCVDPPQAIQPNTPNLYNITISGLTATGATQQSIIAGVPESCILNVNLNNVSISSSESAPTGADGTFLLRNMTGTFNNVNMTSTQSPPIPAWVVQENVQVTATGTPGLTSPVNTPPLTTTPAGAQCAAIPPGNVYPIGYTP